MTDLRKAAEMALEALEGIAKANWRNWEELASPDEFERWAKSRANHAVEVMRQALKHPDDAAWARHLKEPMSEKRVHKSDTMERECSTHPDAPHGFNRDASHGLGRYVCDCEGWEPEPWDTTDMGIDRGAWDDVPDATKWVDELRGGDETEQEPVAWIEKDHLRHAMKAPFMCRVEPTQRLASFIPLHTAPPKREWVGLTDDDIRDIHWSKPMDEFSFARAIEAKLKEKNS